MGEKRRKKARGTIADHKRQIGIKFDPAMFAEILEVAEANRITFAAQVRLLVRRGLELLTAGSSPSRTEQDRP